MKLFAIFKIIRKRLPGKPYPLLSKIGTIKDSSLENAKRRASAQAGLNLNDIQVFPYRSS